LTASKLGLVSLSLRGNNLGTEGVLPISIFCDCSRLDFVRSFRVWFPAAAAIGANLRVNSVLEALNVAHNRLGDDGLCQLAPGLRDNRCLKYLSLADNGFTPARSCDSLCSLPERWM
jgi:Leucine Rich repeat